MQLLTSVACKHQLSRATFTFPIIILLRVLEALLFSLESKYRIRYWCSNLQHACASPRVHIWCGEELGNYFENIFQLNRRYCLWLWAIFWLCTHVLCSRIFIVVCYYCKYLPTLYPKTNFSFRYQQLSSPIVLYPSWICKDILTFGENHKMDLNLYIHIHIPSDIYEWI